MGTPTNLETSGGYKNPLFKQQVSSFNPKCDSTQLPLALPGLLLLPTSTPILFWTSLGQTKLPVRCSSLRFIHRFDALTQFPAGRLMEDKINKCVEILLLVIRPGSDLHCYIVDFYGGRSLLRHPKCGLHRQICRLRWSSATDAAKSACHRCDFTGPVGFKPDRY